MSRYCVNATAEIDAWAYVEADTPEDALEKARGLSVREWELGDVIAAIRPDYAETDA